MAKRQGNKTDADFTEETVSVAIGMFLACLSFRRSRFTIELFSSFKERKLGVDARLVGDNIVGFRPFYMQFKKPSAYLSSSRSKIIKDRKKLGLSVDPQSLFFPLRNKSAEHSDYQHNILFRLRRCLKKLRLGDAAYVCPLFLERSTYYSHVHRSGVLGKLKFWRPYPWILEEILMNNGGKTFHFKDFPVLANHISIPPHAIVDTHNHKYSFNESGSDLCFHSPIKPTEEASTLAAFLKTISQGFLGPRGKITPDTAYQELIELINNMEDSEEEHLPDVPSISRDDPIGSWLSWGDMLHRDYDIEQYAFIRWKEH